MKRQNPFGLHTVTPYLVVDGVADLIEFLQTVFDAELRGAVRYRADTTIQHAEVSVGDSVIKLESQMSILATAVSGAPFLGLLGTVWGVMDTFTGVASAEGAASLKTMAPGVASALLTTVVGLLVAQPVHPAGEIRQLWAATNQP